MNLNILDSMSDTEELIDLDELQDVGQGSQLIVYNDDVNTFNWVIQCFIEVCKHSFEQAEQLSLMIHYTGKACAGEVNNGMNTAQRDDDESTTGAQPEVLSVFPGELYVKNAHKAFGVTKALNGCSFDANFGEIHAIVGGNGCGKSTLAKVLSGVLPMDSGKLSILGNHPSTPSEARQVGIATVFQEVMIADEASILDNLFVGTDGFWTKTMSAREKLEKAHALMSELAAEEVDLLAPAGALPLSMKAWITIGRALLCDPKVLILDEPAGGLDPQARVEMREMIMSLRDLGKTIILSSHILPELGNVCDLVGIINKGYMEAFGSMHDIVQALKEKLTYVVSTESDTAVLAGLLREISEIDEVKEKGGEVIFSFSGARQFSAEVLAYLVGKGMQITSFSEEEADLEEVFMKLAGGKK